MSRPSGSPRRAGTSPGSPAARGPGRPAAQVRHPRARRSARPGRAQDHRVPGPSEAGQNGSVSAPVGVRRVPHPGRDRKGPRRSTPPTRYPFPPSPPSPTPPSHRWATRPSPLDQWPTHLPSATRAPRAPPHLAMGHRTKPLGPMPHSPPLRLHAPRAPPAPSAQARWTDAPPTTPRYALPAPAPRPTSPMGHQTKPLGPMPHSPSSRRRAPTRTRLNPIPATGCAVGPPVQPRWTEGPSVPAGSGQWGSAGGQGVQWRAGAAGGLGVVGAKVLEDLRRPSYQGTGQVVHHHRPGGHQPAAPVHGGGVVVGTEVPLPRIDLPRHGHVVEPGIGVWRRSARPDRTTSGSTAVPAVRCPGAGSARGLLATERTRRRSPPGPPGVVHCPGWDRPPARRRAHPPCTARVVPPRPARSAPRRDHDFAGRSPALPWRPVRSATDPARVEAAAWSVRPEPATTGAPDVDRDEQVHRSGRDGHPAQSVQLERVEAGQHASAGLVGVRGAGCRRLVAVEKGGPSSVGPGRRTVVQQDHAGQQRLPRTVRPAPVRHGATSETAPTQGHQGDHGATARRDQSIGARWCHTAILVTPCRSWVRTSALWTAPARCVQLRTRP